MPAVENVTGGGNNSSSSSVMSLRDRTDDMQAEARAMVRAVNASVYSPQLLASKYGSRPVKVKIDMLIAPKLGRFAAKFLSLQICPFFRCFRGLLKYLLASVRLRSSYGSTS